MVANGRIEMVSGMVCTTCQKSSSCSFQVGGVRLVVVVVLIDATSFVGGNHLAIGAIEIGLIGSCVLKANRGHIFEERTNGNIL